MGRNGYIMTIPLTDPRRQYLAHKIGKDLHLEPGLQMPRKVPTEEPIELPCSNEMCVICCDATITSAINPKGCRHAFACDKCLSQLHKCAMCQANKDGFASFRSITPAISERNPVSHVIMG